MYKGSYNSTHFVFQIMNTVTKKGIAINICGPEMAKFLFELIRAANAAATQPAQEESVLVK